MQKEFFRTGRVWTKNAGLQPIQNVYFSREAVLNLSQKPLLDVPLHMGTASRAAKIFGVKEYKENLAVESYKAAHCNEEFEAYFADFLPFALCHADGEIEQKVAENLWLLAVSQVFVRDEESQNSAPVPVENPFSLLQDSRDKNRWLLFVGNTRDFLENRFEISEQIALLFEKLGVVDKNALARIRNCFIHDDERERLRDAKEFSSSETLKALGIKEEAKGNAGDEAEELVAQKLRNREIGEINDYFGGAEYEVDWVSSASMRKESNARADDTLGYDIALRSPEKTLFVEVKSYFYARTDFHVTPNEIQCAKENAGAHCIVFVGGRKSEMPRIEVLSLEFWGK